MRERGALAQRRRSTATALLEDAGTLAAASSDSSSLLRDAVKCFEEEEELEPVWAAEHGR